jgi:uncharacterized protein with HEPN domain
VSTRDWTERVQDILDAIGEITAYTAGMEFDTFQDDFRTIRAVELNFIIIGEAAGRIPDSVQTTHSEIPWSFMKALRNRLVHAYFDVDPQVLWDTIKNDLPPLAESLVQLLTFTPAEPEQDSDEA